MTPPDPYNGYMYNYVQGIDSSICLSVVSGDDPIRTNKNVRDYRGSLEISLNDKDPYLGVLTID